MPLTEVQVIAWISANWPSVVIGLSAASIYGVAWKRLSEFLSEQERLRKEVERQRVQLNHVKIKLAQLARAHCVRHSEDMDRLMKISEEEEEK